VGARASGVAMGMDDSLFAGHFVGWSRWPWPPRSGVTFGHCEFVADVNSVNRQPW